MNARVGSTVTTSAYRRYHVCSGVDCLTSRVDELGPGRWVILGMLRTETLLSDLQPFTDTMIP